MNKMRKTGILFAFIGLSLYAGEATIDKVVPISHGNKTSVVVFYSGQESLPYHALDSQPEMLTLDLPGVYSRVDFSEISFDQATSVRQEILDPDQSRGLRVVFELNDGVSYSIYDDQDGELTILFESAHIEEAIAAQEMEDVSRDQIVHNAAAWTCDGDAGENRVHKLVGSSDDMGGVLQIFVDGSHDHQTFFLEKPKRFVLDIQGALLSLPKYRFELDHPLVRQVRIRQFKAQPEPVTRMVLDMDEDVSVTVEPVSYGFEVHFAANREILDAAVAQSRMTRDETSATLPVQEAVAVAAVEAEQMEQGHAEVEVAPLQESSDEVVAAEKPQVTESFVEDAPVLPQPAYNDETLVAESEEQQAPVTVEPVMVEEEVVEPKQTLQAALPAVPAQDTPEMVESVDVAEDPRPALPPVEEARVARVTETPKMAALPQIPDNESPATPEFSAAPDVDLELKEFLSDDGPGAYYRNMREWKPTHPRVQAVVVTNKAIDKFNQLGEMRPMQYESGDDVYAGEGGEYETLFNDPSESSFAYETIDGGGENYQGFEIYIDVKDANVVDLLRFIADQVGFNLFVDSSVGDIRATYRFRNIPWDQALDIILTNANLDREFKNGVMRVATTKKFQEEARARMELIQQRELSVPPQTVTFPLNYAKVEDVAELVSEYLSPRGRILVDSRTNTLIIEDIPKKMTAIRALIKKLDRMVSQVTIEARIVETNKRFLKELGIQWGLSAQYSPELGNDTGVQFPNRVGIGGPSIGSTSPGGLAGGYAVNLPTTTENPSGFGLTLGNFLDNFKLDLSLQMLESDGNGQIVSAPKVTTQNNKPAIIKNGQRIPIQTIQRGTITITYIDAVLELNVTPHITSDETVIMDIIVDKSEPDFTRVLSGNPVINIRKAETRVLVKNGGTAVIGGIFTYNEQKSGQGIPTLRRVPVLKRLFGSELQSYENQELLIFVTPRIVKY